MAKVRTRNRQQLAAANIISFPSPPDMQLGNGEGRLPKGINVRGRGGFVVAPGAVRPDGVTWKPTPGFELTQAF